MTVLVDNVRMTVTGTPGTGNITLNASVAPFRTFAASGVPDGTTVPVNIIDGANQEESVVTLSSSGTVLTNRTLRNSTTGSLLNLTSAAVVSSTVGTDDISNVTRVINAQTGTSYTFVIGDAGNVVTFSNAAAVTVTIPQNSSVAFPIGTQIDGWQAGAGQVTFGGTGVTIVSTESNKKLSKQNAGYTLVKAATDMWWLGGGLTA